MFRILCALWGNREHPSLLALKRQLTGQGYEFHQVSFQTDDGESVLAAIQAQRPELLLMDVSACEMGKRALIWCERLKSDPETEHIPVVLLYGGSEASLMQSMVLDGFEHGAVDMISLDMMAAPEILARVKAALRNQRAAIQAITLAGQLDRMNAELYERNLQVEKELYVARQLQQSLLPPFLPDESVLTPAPEERPDGSEGTTRFAKYHYCDDRLRISGVYLPCDALGGDLYDVIAFPGKTVGVSIADVSGHGVPAGFITAIFKSSFYRITHAHGAPDQILFHLNNELADIVKTGDYVTALYTRLQQDGQDLVVEYSGAGHPYPLYYCCRDDMVERLRENGTPLVWVKNMAYPLGRLILQPGDKILLFTDGLTEMRNPSGELYGEEALDRVFLDLVRQNPSRLLDEMVRHLSDFAEGHPMEDDLSIVLIEAL